MIDMKNGEVLLKHTYKDLTSFAHKYICGYYIEIKSLKSENITYVYDSEMAQLLSMELDSYRKIMINEFCADMDINFEICFEKIEDVNKACEWIMSIILMNNLVGDKNEK